MATTTSLIALFNLYLPGALLVSIGAAFLAGLLRWAPRLAARAPERWLAVGWVLLALALVLPGVWSARGMARRPGAPLEIWSGPRADAGDPPAARVSLAWAGTPATGRGRSLPAPLPGVLVGVVVALGAGLFISLARWVVRRRRLGRLCLALPVVKRVARVRVCASDHAPAPFAAAFQGSAFIVVPTALLSDIARLRLVIAHEAHHHRRGDLRAAALFGFLRALFFWNPLLALCERSLAELQDFACDHRVLRRAQVTPLAYGQVLLWAAEAAQGQRYLLSCARGIADGSAASLTRRIVILDENRTDRGKRDTRSRVGGRIGGWILGAAAAALLVGTSWAVHGAVADHRVTRSQADALAARIASRGGFPVLVDEGVVARLNQYIAEPTARDAMRRAMERMPAYRGMIEQALRTRGLPVELLGMVMAESAFDNEAHPDTPIDRRSVGIWQIIPSTGRQLGLAVSPVLDERLEPRRATDAAATMIAHLHQRYRDWAVAIAAYNAGEKKIDSLAAGAASPAELRTLVFAGEEEHTRYLRAVMASVILIDNPSLLE
jgi:hypothetical protein